MIKILNNLNEVERGEQYFKDETGSLKIDCKAESMKIYDLENNIVYSKEYDCYNTSLKLLRIIEGARIKTVEELLLDLAHKTTFKRKEFSKNKILNPFFKELERELKIKSKTGCFTKAQIEKILKHKDIVIIRKNVSTDDYAHDAENNYKIGVEVSRLDMLQEVKEYFHKACEFENGEFTVFTVSHSKSTRIINPNITII